jgi:TPR repeat protein
MKTTQLCRLTAAAAALIVAASPLSGADTSGEPAAVPVPSPEAIFHLAECHAEGKVVAKDEAKALALYRQAAEAGLARAQHRLGHLARAQGDYEEAAKWLRLAAAQNYPPAQEELWILYVIGKAEPADTTELVRWHHMAARIGFLKTMTVADNAPLPDRQYALGLRHRMGQGVKQDYAEAAKWFRLAAVQGHARAQSELALLYAIGLGVLPDRIEAFKWASIAAASGDAELIRTRDILARELSGEEIAEGQRRAVGVPTPPKPKGIQVAQN